MRKTKKLNLSLDEVANQLLEIGIEHFEGKQKKACIVLKSAKKLMSTVMDCANKYASPEEVESYSKEELEYVRIFFEALCESIEDFQKEIVPIKE